MNGDYDSSPRKSECHRFARCHCFQTALIRVRICISYVACLVGLLYYLFWAHALDRASGVWRWGTLTSWATVCLKTRGHCNFISTTCQSMLSEGWRLHSPVRKHRHGVPTLTVHCYIIPAASNTCAWFITALSQHSPFCHTTWLVV